MLTDNAGAEKRLGSLKADHDKLLSKWGVDGNRFRRLLPPLPSTMGGPYFFWAEDDRTAGYRKMQIHGSIFSSLDDAIEILAKDEKALRAATQILLGEIGREKDLPGSPKQGIPVAMQLFQEAHKDYLSCRDQIRSSADEYEKGGITEDFDASAAPIIAKYGELLNNRSAKLAICLGAAYLNRIGSLDPKDRYYFKEQAPIIVDLTGSARRVHDLAMAFLNARMAAVR